MALATFQGMIGINAFWPLGGPQVIVQNGRNRPRPQPDTFLFTDGPAAKHFSSEAIGWLKDAGFDHVRVQYEPLTIMWAIENNDQAFLKWLLDYFEDTVDRLLGSGVGVILSGILAGYAGVMPLDTVFAGMNAPRYAIYKRHLTALAERFAQTDPRFFCLELLNEPPGNGSTVMRQSPNWGTMYTGNWATDYQPDLYALYRRLLPRHTAILTSDGWSNWETLTQLDPSRYRADTNILYTYHPLFPTPASLAGYVYNQYFYIQRLRYPPGAGGQTLAQAIAAMEVLVDQYPGVATNGDPAGTKAGLRGDLERYFNDPQDIDWMRQRIGAVSRWADRNGIPRGNMLAGEWGFTRDSTGFPGNILGTPTGSLALTRLDRIHAHRDMGRVFFEQGQRHTVDHWDTLNYGISLAQNNLIGPFDPLIVEAITPKRKPAGLRYS